MILFTNYRQYYDKEIVLYMSIPNKNPENMKTQNRGFMNPIAFAIINFFNKLRQNPEVYPIKYYKKGSRYKRDWKTTLLK